MGGVLWVAHEQNESVLISRKIHSMTHEFVIMHMTEEEIMKVNITKFVLIHFSNCKFDFLERIEFFV